MGTERTFFLVILAAAAGLAIFILWPSISAIILAAVFAVLFHPLYLRILAVVRRESPAAILTVCIVVFLILVPLTLLGYRMFEQATQLYASLTADEGGSLGRTVTEFLQSAVGRFRIPAGSVNVNEYARQGISWLIQNLGPLFSGLAQVFLTLFLSLFGFYYLLRDGAELRKQAIDLLPLAPEHTEKVLGQMARAVNSVIRGTLAIAVIQGVVAGTGFAIFGVPNAAFWGSFAVLSALVPTVGTSLVMGPAILYLLLTGAMGNALGLLIWGMIAVGMIDNFLAPQLMRRGMSIHPFFILLSVLGGIGLFGPIGFLAGPLTIALLISLLEIYPSVIGPRA